ncbi:hypothetical protein [Halorhabdus sp. CUG00001]|uniref:hypothetical protein n=1 Tax=Halorhabdus sp. CUG00001 TaxID=2600297 RepID=UPI00131C4753|nr:hypothetical protein [Halorhabdus sp. CUG00001]
MELDLDGDLAGDLTAEATERGFDSPEAYARWLLEHREAVLRPPGEQLASRIDALESEIERLRGAIEATGSLEDVSIEAEEWIDESRDQTAWDDDTETAEAGGFEFAGDTETESDGPDTPAESSPPSETEAGSATSLDSQDEQPTPDTLEDTGVSEFAYSDDLEPPSESGDEPAEADDAGEKAEGGADDDEIADAIADIDLAEEDKAADADSNGE